MENTMKMYITADEVAELLGVSRGYQDIYKISITEVLRRNNRIFEWRTLWKNRKLN